MISNDAYEVKLSGASAEFEDAGRKGDTDLAECFDTISLSNCFGGDKAVVCGSWVVGEDGPPVHRVCRRLDVGERCDRVFCLLMGVLAGDDIDRGDGTDTAEDDDGAGD